MSIRIEVEKVVNGWILISPDGSKKVYVTIEHLLTSIKDWLS